MFGGGGGASVLSKSEAAKLVAQINELKKALGEEQRKSKAMETEFRNKDQMLKRAESEMEGFKFRNDQLLKRVEMLQGELNSGSKPSGKSSVSNSAAAPLPRPSSGSDQNLAGNKILEDELRKQIVKNEELRARLDASETQLSLVSSRALSNDNGSTASNQSQSLVAVEATALRHERDHLRERLEVTEKLLKQSMLDRDAVSAMLEAKVALLETKLERQIELDASGTTSSLLLPPESLSSYSRLNVLGSSIRGNRNSEEAEVSIKPRSKSKSVLELEQNLDSLVLSLTAYARASITLMYRLAPDVSSTETSVQTLNNQISAASQVPKNSPQLLLTAASMFETIASFLESLNLPGDVVDSAFKLFHLARDAHSLFSNATSIEVAPGDFTRLSKLSLSAASALQDHYNSLLVAFVGRVDLKPPLDASLLALAGAMGSLESIGSLIETRVRSLDANLSPLFSTDTLPLLLQSFESRTIAFRASTRLEGRPPSVPYERALQLETVLSQTEMERSALDERVERIANRLRKAEEERERWMVEAQLRQVRYEKLLQRVTAGSRSSSESTPVTPDPVLPSQQQQQSEMVGLVTKHFEDRLSLAHGDAASADAEASAWKAESKALMVRLLRAKQLAARVAALEKSLAEREEELDTVRKNYETQLSAMAEHLATMNEKVVSQADESEILRRQILLQQATSAEGANYATKNVNYQTRPSKNRKS